MHRIKVLTRMNVSALNTQSLAGVLQAGGQVASDYEAVWDAIWKQPHVPAPLLELCRLRLAQFHGATAELGLRRDAGLAPRKIDSLLAGNYFRDPDFSPAECAALEFTEIYAQDPAAINDDVADAVKQHFGEPGLMCLIEALGFIDGRIRLALMMSSLRAAGIPTQGAMS
ncbi:MAG: hypothetical protein IPG20_10760 [Gammaproteobacteria bacterium]|nr:hypothetical protein [Gammaproteobacteria bacterium]